MDNYYEVVVHKESSFLASVIQAVEMLQGFPIESLSISRLTSFIETARSSWIDAGYSQYRFERALGLELKRIDKERLSNFARELFSIVRTLR
jgi:hypothetical protein